MSSSIVLALVLVFSVRIRIRFSMCISSSRTSASATVVLVVVVVCLWPETNQFVLLSVKPSGSCLAGPKQVGKKLSTVNMRAHLRLR